MGLCGKTGQVVLDILKNSFFGIFQIILPQKIRFSGKFSFVPRIRTFFTAALLLSIGVSVPGSQSFPQFKGGQLEGKEGGGTPRSTEALVMLCSLEIPSFGIDFLCIV